MRIAVTALSASGLDAEVAGHFGQAPYFVFVDSVEGVTRRVEAVANPFLAGHRPGEIPAFVQAEGADVMISGGMGGRAIQFFAQYGIATATGAWGSVGEAVEDFLRGGLPGAAPCAGSADHGHGGTDC